MWNAACTNDMKALCEALDKKDCPIDCGALVPDLGSGVIGDGVTALMMAADIGKQRLWTSVYKKNWKNSFSFLFFPLGHLEIAKELVRRGADVHCRMPNGRMRNALAWASLAGHDEIVRFLLDEGVSVDDGRPTYVHANNCCSHCPRKRRCECVDERLRARSCKSFATADRSQSRRQLGFKRVRFCNRNVVIKLFFRLAMDSHL